jgi:hypothetical protein
MAAMLAALPRGPGSVYQQFHSNPAGLLALLAFLSLLLRLWTIVGELMLAAVTVALDYRGVLSLPGAKARLEGMNPREQQAQERIGEVKNPRLPPAAIRGQ